MGAGTALEDIVNEHKKKETHDRSNILWFLYFAFATNASSTTYTYVS